MIYFRGLNMPVFRLSYLTSVGLEPNCIISRIHWHESSCSPQSFIIRVSCKHFTIYILLMSNNMNNG